MTQTSQPSIFLEEVVAEEFEIRPPSPPPARPAVNLWLVFLPAVFMGLSAIAMLIVALTSAAAPAQLLMNFSMFGFMLVSVLTSWLNHRFQQEQYKTAALERSSRYKDYLRRRGGELEQLLSAHILQRELRYPRASECYQAALRREAMLWQRDMRHLDFLAVRIGLGTIPSPVKVKLQEPDPNQPVDELYSEAECLKKKGMQLENAPVVLPLATINVIGLVGLPSETRSVAANWIVQIAALHTPGSVYLAGAFPLVGTREEHWRWLRWLPHVWTPGRAKSLLATNMREIHALAERVEELCQGFSTSGLPEQENGLQPHVVIFADLDTLPGAVSLLRPLIARRANVHLIALASSVALLPRECNWIVECSTAAYVRRVQPLATANVRLDTPVQPTVLELFAETLMRFWEQEFEESTSDGNASSVVTLFQLWEDDETQRISSVKDIDVAEAWRRNLPFERNRRTLAIPIGRDDSGALVYLNLHDREDPEGRPSHGPHGLVAGATGSGKSELLQSLIASLAAHFSPEILSFLLVDYKGGGTADVFKGMPHIAGIVTNLADESLSQRALLALQSELQRRQERFQQAGVNYIDDYQRRRASDRSLPPVPRLVIIVDEFAELAQNQPEFIRQLVRTARIGRSLGVHLILATQKPSGVVNDQIWSNSRFRICLRVETPADSNDVLKRPDAARLTRSGQAYLQVGSGEIFLRFQAAYANAPYIEGAADLVEPVFEVELDGSRRLLSTPRIHQHSAEQVNKARLQQAPETQLKALVQHIIETAEQLNLKPVEPIWVQPLPNPRESERPFSLFARAADEHHLDPSFYPVDQGWDEGRQCWRPARHWLSPLVGLLDDPRNRRQDPLRIPLGDPPAHLLVYGMPSSGKTTFLLTLAVSLTIEHTPEEVNLYVLDFGARALSVLTAFPHTADVILRDDSEKVVRLFRTLHLEAERRRRLFAEVGVSNFRAYLEERLRDPSRHRPLPAIVVLIDGYSAFIEGYPDQEAQLEQLMRECAGQGIHFVIAGGSAMSIKPRIAASAALAVTFQQTDPGDYSSIVGRTALRPASLPGRGLVRHNPPLEFQVALPVSGESEVEQTELLRALGGRMRAAWRGMTPSPVPVLPETLPLCDLLKTPKDDSQSAYPPIALATDTLSPFGVPLEEGPHFLIVGPPQGGKTTLLLSWMLALAEWHPPEQLRLFLSDLSEFPEEGLGAIKSLPHCAGFAQDVTELGAMLERLNEELAQWKAPKDLAVQEAQMTIFALDNFSRLAKAPPSWLAEQMLKLVQQSRGSKFHIVIASHDDVLARMYNQEWLDLLKGLRSGFLVGTSQSSSVSFRLPPGESQRATPVGFGYFGSRRRTLAVRLKFATPFAGALTLPDWVNLLSQRYASSCASSISRVSEHNTE